MNVTFEDATNRITDVKYQNLPDYPKPFSNATFGSFKGRSLIMGGDYGSNACFEFDRDEWQAIPYINVNRFWAASTFIQYKIVVAGGYGTLAHSDNIEILDWDESNHGTQWIQSPSRLPIEVHSHTLVTLNNKLYLIGGRDSYNKFSRVWRQFVGIYGNMDKIWEGTFNKEDNKISWVEMELRLQKKRSRHFSIVISNQIIIFGGYVEGEDVVEILIENKLKQGPKVPFKLSTEYDQAVLDRKNRIIITSRHYGLIVYDHKEGAFQSFPNFKLREERKGYAAILQ